MLLVAACSACLDPFDADDVSCIYSTPPTVLSAVHMWPRDICLPFDTFAVSILPDNRHLEAVWAYVSPSGNDDDCDGSWEKPCRTVHGALNRDVPFINYIITTALGITAAFMMLTVIVPMFMMFISKMKNQKIKNV